MQYKSLLVLFIALASLAGTANAENPPEVQSVLEQAAASAKGMNDGTVMVSETIIGDHALEFRMKAAPNVEATAASAGIKTKGESWARKMCASASISDFLRRTGTTLTMTFETAPGVYEPQAKADAATCPVAQPRTIDGKTLYPQPSRDEAIEKVANHLKYTLRDYDSAKINCTNVSEAIWMKLPLTPRAYGYVMQCDINAKNGFGGYAGFESRYYYFNGPIFEEYDYQPKMDLLNK